MKNTISMTEQQAELLRKNGRFPDDFNYIGMHDNKMKFKNKSEGFTIELEII